MCSPKERGVPAHAMLSSTWCVASDAVIIVRGTVVVNFLRRHCFPCVPREPGIAQDGVREEISFLTPDGLTAPLGLVLYAEALGVMFMYCLGCTIGAILRLPLSLFIR